MNADDITVRITLARPLELELEVLGLDGGADYLRVPVDVAWDVRDSSVRYECPDVVRVTARIDLARYPYTPDAGHEPAQALVARLQTIGALPSPHALETAWCDLGGEQEAWDAERDDRAAWRELEVYCG